METYHFYKLISIGIKNYLKIILFSIKELLITSIFSLKKSDGKPSLNIDKK